MTDSRDDWYERMPRIQKLWVDLSRARHRVEEGESVLERLQLKPWDCDDPLITEAWKALTAPENLEELVNWRNQSANPSALEAMEEAIEDCRRRREDEE